jgi:hypothetical protein
MSMRGAEIFLSPYWLDGLDSVQVTILNTVDIRPWAIPEGVSHADAEAVMWAGWEFNTFFGPVSGHAANNRQSRPRPYSRATGKDWEQLLLRETRPPPWSEMGPEKWQASWRNIPLRLRLDCSRLGYDPWVVYCNIEVERSGATADSTQDG